jgi:hypothetical protein
MPPLISGGLRAGLLLLCVAPAVLQASPAATAAVQEAEETLDAIESEFDQEVKELRKLLREAASEEERSVLFEDFSQNIVPEFTRRYAELARGSPVALRAWLKVFGLGSQYRLYPDLEVVELEQEGLGRLGVGPAAVVLDVRELLLHAREDLAGLVSGSPT